MVGNEPSSLLRSLWGPGLQEMTWHVDIFLKPLYCRCHLKTLKTKLVAQNNLMLCAMDSPVPRNRFKQHDSESGQGELGS